MRRIVTIAVKGLLYGVALCLALGAMATFYFIHTTRTEFRKTLAETRPTTWITLDAVPKQVVRAVLAVEGSTFFQCDRYTDLKQLFGLLTSEAVHHDQRPNCGISYQVVRGVISQQGRTKMLYWHLKGIVGEYDLHSQLTNRQILEEYMNRVYVGKGRNGLEEGAKLLYRKPLSSLTMEEAAGLAAILKAPDYYLSGNHSDRLKERQAYIVQKLKVEDIQLEELVKQ